VVNTVKVILATLVIFGAGVITGAFAVRIAQTKPPFQLLPAPPVVATQKAPALVLPNTIFNRPEFLKRMEREVGLRPDQHTRIDEILAESRKRTEPIVREFNPKIRAEVQVVRDQITQVLDPEQRLRFDELMRARPNQVPALDQPGRGNRRLPTPPTTAGGTPPGQPVQPAEASVAPK
jgi:hypothetical protein